MKIGSIKYLTGEGIKNAWVNRLMSLASIGVLVACMIIIGLAVLITENVNLAIGKLEQQNVVMAYMKDYNWALYDNTESDTASTDAASAESDEQAAQPSNASDDDTAVEEADVNGIKNSDYVIHNEDEAKALCEKISKLDNVADVTFVSSDEGLETIKKTMLEDGQEEFFTFLNDDYGNPLPCAAKITMKDMALFDKTIDAIKSMDGIDSIRSYDDLADKITVIKKGISVAGIAIISILVAISLVIVSNTISVTMHNRKLEICIMKAVGATDAFVRIPFIVEGMIIGIVSALIAEGALYFCYRVATEKIIMTLQTNDIVKYGDLAWWLLLIFVSIGIIAGVIGSVIIISKYLRKEGSEFTAI